MGVSTSTADAGAAVDVHVGVGRGAAAVTCAPWAVDVVTAVSVGAERVDVGVLVDGAPAGAPSTANGVETCVGDCVGAGGVWASSASRWVCHRSMVSFVGS